MTKLYLIVHPLPGADAKENSEDQKAVRQVIQDLNVADKNRIEKAWSAFFTVYHDLITKGPRLTCPVPMNAVSKQPRCRRKPSLRYSGPSGSGPVAICSLTNGALHADKHFVDRRDKPRFPADLKVSVTDLADGSETFAGNVIDISESGVCADLPKHLLAGSLVKLELDDAVLYGHVTYAFGTGAAFRTGIAAERVLLGTSDLSNILQALLDASPHTTLRPATP